MDRQLQTLTLEEPPNTQFHEFIYVDESDIHGRGIFSSVALPKDVCVGEYTGEVIDASLWQQRYPDENDDHFSLSCGGGIIIDAKKKGSLLRYINHSCESNCRFVPYNIHGQLKAFIFTIKEISAVRSLFLILHLYI